MSEKQAEYVTDDPLGELLDDFGHAAHDLYNGYGNCYDKYEHDIREYVDALVTGGITAQIADLLEQVAALQERIESLEYTKDAYWQVIQAKTERVAELEKAIIESGIKVDLLKSELRERDE